MKKYVSEKMGKTGFLIIILLCSFLHSNCVPGNNQSNSQVGPFQGYGNIPWGASPENIRNALLSFDQNPQAYPGEQTANVAFEKALSAYHESLGQKNPNVKDAPPLPKIEEFVLISDKDDPNFASITVHYDYKESAISSKIFWFNKWNDDKYKLYRVIVQYFDASNNDLRQNLIDHLTSIYGNVTSTNKDDPEMGNAFLSQYTRSTTNYVFGKYSPNITVWLKNDSIFLVTALTRSQEMKYSNTVYYTWTKFLDSYLQTQKQKIQL